MAWGGFIFSGWHLWMWGSQRCNMHFHWIGLHTKNATIQENREKTTQFQNWGVSFWQCMTSNVRLVLLHHIEIAFVHNSILFHVFNLLWTRFTTKHMITHSQPEHAENYSGSKECKRYIGRMRETHITREREREKDEHTHTHWAKEM